MISLRLALRILRNEKLFSLLFTLNLALGLSGFLTIEGFKNSLERILSSQAQAILGGDLTISARRPFTEAEEKAIQENSPKGAVRSRTVEFFAMLSSPKSSSLVLVRAVDENYPVRGNLELESMGPIPPGGAQSLQTSPNAWADSILLERFNFSPNQNIRLGSAQVLISDRITKDSSQASRAFAFGGRLYVSLALAKQSELLKPGSTATHTVLLGLPQNENPKELKAKLGKALQDPAISIRGTEDAGDQSARALTVLSDYLGLAALVSMCLAALGSVFLFADYLRRRYRDIAILNALGSSALTSLSIVLWQVLVLTILGAALAISIAALLLPLLVNLLQQLSPVTLDPRLDAVTIRNGFLIISCVLGGLFAPLGMRLARVPSAELFRSQNFAPPWSRRQWLLFLPAIIIFCLLCVWQAKSWQIGFVFIGGLFAASLLLLGVGFSLQVALRVLPQPLQWIWLEASRNWERRPSESVTVLLAIGLGILLTSLLPQIAKSVRAELDYGSLAKVPSLFFFDIQEDQKLEFQEILRANGTPQETFSPLIRARLLAVNAEAFERVETRSSLQTREEELETRFRNRGLNLTIREMLHESETIVVGRIFSEQPVTRTAAGQEIAEISVEYRFAKRLGLKLGDTLRFDVQGVEVLGRVINFRKVNWLSFQPNFFIVFPPGIIDGAPKTYLTTLAKLPSDQRAELQRKLSESFTNVSQVNVEEAIRTIFDLLERCQNALLLMAALAIACGLLVIATVFAQQLRSRRNDLLLFKILGASDRQIIRTLMAEFLALVLLASVAGASISIGLAKVILYFFFDLPLSIDWIPLTFCFAAILIMSLATLRLITARWMRQSRPLELLQS